jgi:uncharacterized protein involved in exopolysaccharide biosynthesis
MSYYFSIFVRRLPWFLLVATIISALALVVAASMPPAFVSQARLILERAQIPGELATSTVTTPALEQMQLLEQNLMTRANLLDIARRLNVLRDQDKMNPDEIVEAMRARTGFVRSTGASSASLMTISFEAPTARNSAAVVNEYLTLVLQQNVDFRTGRAEQTQEFFQQEVDRLAAELEIQSNRILEFKTANADALPEGLSFRLSRQSSVSERILQTDREIALLREQRDRIVSIFEATGRLEGVGGVEASPEERKLDLLREELSKALLIYSAENPRVKTLQAQITQLETVVKAQTQGSGDGQEISLLDVQLAEIDSRVAVLEGQRTTLETELAALADAISRTPANEIVLDGLNRDYGNVQAQYNSAVERLAKANTGERIELLSRGQRITVLEQPTVPNAPTRPNRVLIAGGGGLFGIIAGLGLIMLLELLNRSVRRPVDLVNKLGISPITTIPYIRTRGEVLRQRSLRIVLALLIVIGIPALVYGVHLYYQPLDLLAERVMNKLGVRW